MMVSKGVVVVSWAKFQMPGCSADACGNTFTSGHSDFKYHVCGHTQNVFKLAEIHIREIIYGVGE